VRRLRVTVIDLTTERPTRALYARLMNANLASIMPQAVAVWCEEAGHLVRYVCFTGFEDLAGEVLGEAERTLLAAERQFRPTGAAARVSEPAELLRFLPLVLLDERWRPADADERRVQVLARLDPPARAPQELPEGELGAGAL
jgi:hypothetical protein